MLLSTFPFYIQSLGGNEALAGLAATLFSLIAVICRPFIGWMLDNGKRKAILVVGICGLILMPVGYMCVSVLFLAFVCRMVHGASLACSNTSTSTIATDIIPKQRFAEGMGMFGMATALATSCAPALGLYLMDNMGFTTLFLCSAGSAVIALIIFLLLKVPRVEAVKKPLSFKALIDRDALPASSVMLVFLLTFGALENFLAKYARDNSLPTGGIYFAIMSCMLLLVRITVGKVATGKGKAFSSTLVTPPCLPLSCCWPFIQIPSPLSCLPYWPVMVSADSNPHYSLWPYTLLLPRGAAPLIPPSFVLMILELV